MQFKPVILIMIAGLLLAACSVLEMDDASKNLVQNFYNNLQANNPQANLQYFSDDFYTVTTADDTLKLLKWQADNVGTFQSYQLQNLYIGHNTGGTKKPAGTTIKVSYEVTWSNGKTVDSFLLFKPNSESTYKIDGYNTIIQFDPTKSTQ